MSNFFKMIIFFIAIIFYNNASASEKISEQNFENDDWENQFTGSTTWSGKVLRTNSNAMNGYSIRGNQKNGVIDPITGGSGMGNYLLDWRGNGDLVNLTPNEMYFSYWFRHDDYNWNDLGNGKLFYFVDSQYSIGAMYYAQQLQEGRDTLRITYANGGYSSTWAQLEQNWGYSSLQLGNENVTGKMAQWRHFEYYINYQEHYFTQWIDGYLLKPTNGRYSDGKIYYDPGLDIHWQGFQLFYAAYDVDVANSTDGISGYAAGWQIDDLEIWNGMPVDDMSAPYSPQGLNVL
ncbi:MAG: hypothetical protein V3574_00095 [Candidatus Moraniibacteriota bacterium]